MIQELPHITLSENLTRNKVTIGILNQEETVDLIDFNECMRELRISSIEMLRARFAEVCDWFIAKSQYVQFEMIPNA